MAYVTETNKSGRLGATTDDGDRIVFEGLIKSKKEYFPVKEVDEKFNLRNVFIAISEACRSSKDIEILGYLLERTDYNNYITISNLSELAEELGVSRKHLNTILKRAEEATLIHKIETGKYMVNPYKIMGASACKAGYETQELNQVRWKELTGLFTDLEIQQLIDLNKYMEFDVPLRPTSFNISIAEYYAKNKFITDKQRESLVKHNN